MPVRLTRESILSLTGDKGAQFVREDIKGKLVVNYLSIDACIEEFWVSKKLYKNKYQLEEALTTEGHNVTFGASETNIHVTENKAEKVDNETLVNSIINNVVDKDPEELKELRSHSKSKLERTIIDTCIEFAPYIDRTDIIKILKSLSRRDNREFNNLKTAAHFLTLHDKSSFKVQLDRYFKTGSSFTHEKLLQKWKMINVDAGLGINTKSMTESFVVHLTKLYFKTTKRRDTPKGDPIEIKIIGTNPKDFMPVKKRKDPTEKLWFNK